MSTVLIHLYDLSNGVARNLSPMLVGKVIEGIWHTGVVVFGYEYYYSGGICKDRIGTTQAGSPYRTIKHGVTNKTQSEFEAFLSTKSSKYSMATYHLINNNCNNFSDECCLFLTGNGLPSYITGLPQEFINTPFGQSMLPFINQMFGGGQGGANAPVQGTSLFSNNQNSSPYSFPPSSSSSSSSSTSSSSSSSSNSPSPFPILSNSKIFLYESASFERIIPRLIENADAFAKSHPSLTPMDLLAQGILSANDRAFLQSPQLRDFLSSLLTKTSSRAPSPASPIHPLPILPPLLPLLRRIFSTWDRGDSGTATGTTPSSSSSAQLLLPAIDLLRIICLHSEGAAAVCNSKAVSGGVGGGHDNPLFIFNVFRTGFFSTPTPTTTNTNSLSTSSPSSPSPASTSSSLPPASDTLRLMSIRMAVNLFATPAGAAFVTSPTQTLPPAFARVYGGAGRSGEKDENTSNVSFFLSIACDLIQSGNVAFLKQVAACLIHNIAITLKASESNNSAENEHTHEFLSGFCVRTLAEGIVRENVWRKVAEGTLAKTATEKKDPKDAKEVKEREDTLTVFLKAVGVILLNDDVAAVSFASIGQDAEEEGKGEQTKAPFNVVKEIKEDKKETSMMVKDICTEIVGILELLM